MLHLSMALDTDCQPLFLDTVLVFETLFSQAITNLCVSSVLSDSLLPYGLYVAHRAALSMELSRQEYWSGVPLPSPNPRGR